jgi:hypothetical protein
MKEFDNMNNTGKSKETADKARTVYMQTSVDFFFTNIIPTLLIRRPGALINTLSEPFLYLEQNMNKNKNYNCR